ncbi:MAG: N-formylglutamate amidohydrolase, partial [Emcibacter sp.]|nr:N-formylglutamate amidohydrolase [Emcibacter sp.]
RFKGGYITRHYGNPARNIHAFQLEISQITYMDEAPTFAFQEERANKLRPTLKKMIEAFRP